LLQRRLPDQLPQDVKTAAAVKQRIGIQQKKARAVLCAQPKQKPASAQGEGAASGVCQIESCV